MIASKSDVVLADLDKMKEALGDHLIRLALFGSSIRCGMDAARDVDVALFVEGICVDDVRSLLLGLRLNLPVRATSINGKYISSCEPHPEGQLHYHVIVLHAEDPNEKFMRINRASIQYLN